MRQDKRATRVKKGYTLTLKKYKKKTLYIFHPLFFDKKFKKLIQVLLKKKKNSVWKYII